MTTARRPNPVLAGLRGRCPNCGRGKLFKGFLTVADRCGACGFDLKAADSGDGPAVFVMLVGGFMVAIPALLVEIAYSPPIAVQLAIWLPAALIVSVGLLRPFKGVMLALQFHNRAAEVRNDDF